jgi:hypothetical protein
LLSSNNNNNNNNNKTTTMAQPLMKSRHASLPNIFVMGWAVGMLLQFITIVASLYFAMPCVVLFFIFWIHIMNSIVFISLCTTGTISKVGCKKLFEQDDHDLLLGTKKKKSSNLNTNCRRLFQLWVIFQAGTILGPFLTLAVVQHAVLVEWSMDVLLLVYMPSALLLLLMYYRLFVDSEQQPFTTMLLEDNNDQEEEEDDISLFV